LTYRSLPGFSSTKSNGTANVAGLYATYAWRRDGTETRTVNLSIESKNYQNLTNDAEVSAYGATKLTAGVAGALMGEKQSLSYAVNVGLGHLGINNAAQLSSDQSASGPQTSGQFAKLSVNLGLNADLPVKNTSARLTLNGQLASKNLNSSEQMYLGGPDSVRAYPVAQGGGSQGIVGSLEVTHAYAQALQLAAFFDLGVIQQYKFNWSPALQGSTKADNTYSLKAAGLAVKYAWSDFQLQAVLAFRLGDNPLHSSTGAQLNTDNAYRKAQAWVKGSYLFN
jgi:hemolysin activation/secretion protein